MFYGTSIGPDDEVIDTSDSTAPSIPIGLAVDQNASIEDSIKITWEANIDSDFDKYRIYRATGVDSLPLYVMVGETRLTHHRDTGMEYNTNYYYRVSAVDKNRNESEKSTAIQGVSVNINPPVIPTGFTVYAYNLPGESPKVRVRWDANTESDLDHYSIYRHSTLQLTPDSSYFIAQTTNNIYTDTDVEVGTKYYYRITAVDKGLLASNAVNAKYDLPLARPSLIHPVDGYNTETLRPSFGWQRIANATKYEVIVQTSSQSGEYWRGEVTQPSSGDIVEMGYPSSPALQYNTEYYWRVAVFSSDNTAANTYSDSTWWFLTPSSSN